MTIKGIKRFGVIAPICSLMFAAACSSPAVSNTVTVAEKSAEETTVTSETTTAATTVPRTYDKSCALTFDDGPNTITTPQVLDLLEKYDIPASFFLIGNNINDSSAEVVKRAFDMGCEINSHSKTHSFMNQMEAEDIIAEMDFTSDKIEEITGKRPAFFRPPYIAVNDTMFDNIDLPFIAGIGANDWDDKVSAEDRAKRIIDNASDGCIILLHDSGGNSKTVEALDTIIPTLLDEGYEFLTVTDLFAKNGVEPQGRMVYSNVNQTTMY